MTSVLLCFRCYTLWTVLREDPFSAGVVRHLVAVKGGPVAYSAKNGNIFAWNQQILHMIFCQVIQLENWKFGSLIHFKACNRTKNLHVPFSQYYIFLLKMYTSTNRPPDRNKIFFENLFDPQFLKSVWVLGGLYD